MILSIFCFWQYHISWQLICKIFTKTLTGCHLKIHFNHHQLYLMIMPKLLPYHFLLLILTFLVPSEKFKKFLFLIIFLLLGNGIHIWTRIFIICSSCISFQKSVELIFWIVFLSASKSRCLLKSVTINQCCSKK